MKQEYDGFKIVGGNDNFYKSVHAINENTILLRRQIKDLQDELDVLRKEIDQLKNEPR